MIREELLRHYQRQQLNHSISTTELLHHQDDRFRSLPNHRYQPYLKPDERFNTKAPSLSKVHTVKSLLESNQDYEETSVQEEPEDLSVKPRSDKMSFNEHFSRFRASNIHSSPDPYTTKPSYVLKSQLSPTTNYLRVPVLGEQDSFGPRSPRSPELSRREDYPVHESYPSHSPPSTHHSPLSYQYHNSLYSPHLKHPDQFAHPNAFEIPPRRAHEETTENCAQSSIRSVKVEHEIPFRRSSRTENQSEIHCRRSPTSQSENEIPFRRLSHSDTEDSNNNQSVDSEASVRVEFVRQQSYNDNCGFAALSEAAALRSEQNAESHSEDLRVAV